MKIGWTTQPLDRIRTDLLLVPTTEGQKGLGEIFRELDRVTDGALEQMLDGTGFQGKSGQLLVLPAGSAIKARRVVLIGLGKADAVQTRSLRLAFGRAVRALGPGEHSVAARVTGTDQAELVRAAVEGLALTSYSFLKYRKKVDPAPARVIRLTLSHAKREKALEHAATEGHVLAAATNVARDLVNEPPGNTTPTDLARAARRIAKQNGLTLKVFGRAELTRRKMGGILGVAAGTREEPKLIHMEYKPTGRATRTVALVGKGITFDSGGLSLKPPAGMMTMKCDMAGGAAVIAAMQAIAELAPRVRVHAIVAASENLPGPGATMPGDVLRISTGKTVEVLNTDAEGRLVLADALAYAESLGVDDIVDMATLTGACVVALGEKMAAVYGRDRDLAQALQDAGEVEGEALWEMPLFDGYRRELKSEVADLKNIGGRMGGSITAALFLGEFVTTKRWAHIDIAGPAFPDGPSELGPKGASGFGVRTLVRWVLSL